MKNIQKRFGAIAIQKGFITAEQLAEALAIQAQENVAQGAHRLVGMILLDSGYITEAQIEEVIETLNHSMLFAIASGR